MAKPNGHAEPGLPASIDAERLILGAAIMDIAVMQQADAAGLRSTDFYLTSHRVIYETLVEMMATNMAVDLCTLSATLTGKRKLDSIGGSTYLSSLTEGLPKRESIGIFVSEVRKSATLRALARAASSALSEACMVGADVDTVRSNLEARLAGIASVETHGRIAKLELIPDIFSLDAGPVEWLVDNIIPARSLVVIAGDAGIGKTWVALQLAKGVALGGEFLGRACTKAPVAYLDRENPLPLMRRRLDVVTGGPLPGLAVWGGWLEDPPPLIGDPRVLAFAKAHQPLIILDSFIRFHAAEENDASEMRAVMGALRSLANVGATVVVLHHRPKAEGATYRGSSDIAAAPDVVMSLARDDGELLGLASIKNRFGPDFRLHLRPVFDEGRFELVDSPMVTQKQREQEEIAAVIAECPGITQNEVLKRVGDRGLSLGRNRGIQILRDGDGRLWLATDGPRHARVYHPLTGTDCPVPVPYQSTMPRPLVRRYPSLRTVPVPVGAGATGADWQDVEPWSGS